MDREILFRGKRDDNGEWVYGLPVYDYSGRKIDKIESPFPSGGFCRAVLPETVGQFTGLTDKNGAKIFEGDILEVKDENAKIVIKFIGGQFVGINMDENHPIRETKNRNWIQWEKTVNIHDNK